MSIFYMLGFLLAWLPAMSGLYFAWNGKRTLGIAIYVIGTAILLGTVYVLKSS